MLFLVILNACKFYLIHHRTILVNWRQSYRSCTEQLDFFPLENSMKFSLSKFQLIVFCINDIFTLALRFVREIVLLSMYVLKQLFVLVFSIYTIYANLPWRNLERSLKYPWHKTQLVKFWWPKFHRIFKWEKNQVPRKNYCNSVSTWLKFEISNKAYRCWKLYKIINLT